MSRKKVLKIIMLGDSAVGKTSLFSLYFDEGYRQLYKATVGADFQEKEIIVDGKPFILEMWDTAGQERFRSFSAFFYRGTDCCVLVYDITNKKSFENIESWMQEFLSKGNPKDPENFPFVFIGNKIDLQENHAVGDQILQQFLSKHPKIHHLTTSAKNRQNVQSAFQKIAEVAISNHEPEVELSYADIHNDIWKKRRGCC